MNEFKIEVISKRKGADFIPAQVLGDKRILRTAVSMTIKECKEWIAEYKAEQTDGNKGEWVLLEVVS